MCVILVDIIQGLNRLYMKVVIRTVTILARAELFESTAQNRSAKLQVSSYPGPFVGKPDGLTKDKSIRPVYKMYKATCVIAVALRAGLRVKKMQKKFLILRLLWIELYNVRRIVRADL